MGNKPCCGEECNSANAEVVQCNPKAEAELPPLPVAKSALSTASMESVPDTPKTSRSVQEAIDSMTEASTNNIKKKQHLQAYVRDFVKELVKGVEVELVTTGSETLEPTFTATACSLDKTVKNLHLNSKDGNIVCPLDKIHHVVQIDDGKDAFPEKVRTTLTEEDLEKTIMVRYVFEGGEKKAFVMREKTVENRKRFYQCIKILHMHAVKSTDPANSPLNSPR